MFDYIKYWFTGKESPQMQTRISNSGKVLQDKGSYTSSSYKTGATISTPLGKPSTVYGGYTSSNSVGGIPMNIIILGVGVLVISKLLD